MAESKALRGIAILGIILHNYCHFLGFAVKENEYTFTASKPRQLLERMLMLDDNLFIHVMSYFGHYGVPVFLFISGFGLVYKYERSTPTRVRALPFIGFHYAKLLRLMFLGYIGFAVVSYLHPHGYHGYTVGRVIAQLLMYINLINELGIEGFRACDNTSMWYCGPYIVEEYIQGNTKSYIPNPNYYAANDCTRFEHHTITMIPDLSMGLQLYENGEVDNIDLTESNLTTITSDPNNEHNKFLCEKRPTKFSFQMHLNFQRKDENGNLDENWNKAVSNRAFRQCFYKGINFTNYYARTNKINPLKCENDYYTMKGLCYNTQGAEYTTLVAKEMGFDSQSYDGKTMIRLRDNGGDIADLKKQAMEELSAIGVTFPVKATYFIIASSTSALDNATILKQCFSDSFGDDFIKLDIQTYVSSLTQEVRTPQLQSFVINGWSADFGDPVNFLGQETLHDDNAFYSHYYSNIARVAEAPADYQKDLMDAFEQYTDLVNAANAIVNDTDARYEAFAKAEAYMLENVLVSPTYYDIAWSLTHANEYSKINAMYGPCNYKAVNWETSEEAYTTVQYEQFAKAFDLASQG